MGRRPTSRRCVLKSCRLLTAESPAVPTAGGHIGGNQCYRVTDGAEALYPRSPPLPVASGSPCTQQSLHRRSPVLCAGHRVVCGRLPHLCPAQCERITEGTRIGVESGEAKDDAHLKRQVMGREVLVAITDGRLDDSTELVEVFGPWEQIFYGKFDGRRRKRVLVTIIGEVARVQVSNLAEPSLGGWLRRSPPVGFDRSLRLSYNPSSQRMERTFA
jgi:hypothetical protein